MHGGEFTHPSIASLADPLFRKQKRGAKKRVILPSLPLAVER